MTWKQGVTVLKQMPKSSLVYDRSDQQQRQPQVTDLGQQPVSRWTYSLAKWAGSERYHQQYTTMGDGVSSIQGWIEGGIGGLDSGMRETGKTISHQRASTHFARPLMTDD